MYNIVYANISYGRNVIASIQRGDRDGGKGDGVRACVRVYVYGACVCVKVLISEMIRVRSTWSRVLRSTALKASYTA